MRGARCRPGPPATSRSRSTGGCCCASWETRPGPRSRPRGRGKGLVARAIHRISGRGEGPFIKITGSAIPPPLWEAEVFGYEKGAFTGAVLSKPGRFELADGGTFFLDEIGDVPLAMQAKLLRVLQDRPFERGGGVKTLTADVRFLCASNRDLKKETERGRFREDLYYRINGIPVHLPPLRERRGGIPSLAGYFFFPACAGGGGARRARPRRRKSPRRRPGTTGGRSSPGRSASPGGARRRRPRCSASSR